MNDLIKLESIENTGKVIANKNKQENVSKLKEVGVEKRVLIPKPKLPEAYGVSNLYRLDRQNPNRFSKWYPHIKDCGIRVPRTLIILVQEDVFEACYDPAMPKEAQIIESFVKAEIIPLMFPEQEYFCKNGCFSNKFDFQYCINTRETILEGFKADTVCFSMFRDVGCVGIRFT